MKIITHTHYFWTVTILRLVATYFLLAVSVAIFLYPGGNIHDCSQVGYSLTHNFLSDLGAYQSHSGEINFYSSLFFNTAMLGFSLIAVSFCYVPLLFQDKASNFKIAISGSVCICIGALLFSAVGLTQADLYKKEHIFFAINAPRCLSVGGLLYFIVLYRSDADRIFLITMAAFFSLVFAYAIYQLVTLDDAISTMEKLVMQATIQKAIVIVMLASMIVMSFTFSAQLRRLKLSQEIIN